MGTAKYDKELLVQYGQRLLPQIIDQSAADDPNRLVGLMTKSSDISKGFTNVTIEDVAIAVDFMAYWLEENVGKRNASDTVAFLGSNDFRYWAVMFGGMKCSKRILLPSTRNSTANNVSLLEATNCRTVLCTELHERVAVELQDHDNVNVRVLVLPSWADMVRSQHKIYPYTKTWTEAKNDTIIILRTSGSTGNPKPIPYTNAFLAFFDVVRLQPNPKHTRPNNISSLELGPAECLLMAFPLFHIVGLSLSLRPLLYEGVVVFGPSQAVQNSKIVTDVMTAVPCKAIALPPSLLEDVVKEYRIEFERSTTQLLQVLYGGGPLAESTGNYLSRRVRDICTIYGQTEIAMPPLLLPDPDDWQAFHFHPTHSGIELSPIGDEEDHHELIINRIHPEVWWQPVFKNFPELEEWRTKDLFKRHPTKPHLWYYKGRKDNTIVLSNGEKFNPVSMELTILGHPAVKGVLVVGTSRFQCGLILEPQDYMYTAEDSFINQIWPMISEANALAPGCGQIHRDLVMMSKPEKAFQRAGKGTVMRYHTTTKYSTEIDDMYTSFEIKSSSNPPTLHVKDDLSSITLYIQKIVARYLIADCLSHTSDLFGAGLDSLKATQISRDLQAALGSKSNRTNITVRTLYEHPSIKLLSLFVFEKMNNINIPNDNFRLETPRIVRIAQMQALVDIYTAILPTVPDKQTMPRQNKSLNVILTGSTGSLGAHILNQLLDDPSMGTIYCLDRSTNAENKFISRKSRKGKRRTDKFVEIRWLKVEASEAKFALSDEEYNDLLKNIDVTILNAWKVDFNHTLSSFTRQIQSVHNFATFCLQSPRSPHLFFVSSVSAVGSFPTVYPEESLISEIVPTDLSVAAPMGYGESKLVAENLLHHIATNVSQSVNFNILRVGQIAGPMKGSGIWNENEWFPALIKTSKAMRMVPETLAAFDQVNWVPVGVVAEIVVDVMKSSFKLDVAVEFLAQKGTRLGAHVFNIVNPRPLSFKTLLLTTEHHLNHGEDHKVEVVSFSTWVHALEILHREDQHILDQYPALKILDFYKGLQIAHGEKATGFATERTEAASRTMKQLGSITGTMMSKWICGWGIDDGRGSWGEVISLAFALGLLGRGIALGMS